MRVTRRESFEAVLDDRTDRSKLEKCTIDLRAANNDPCQGAAVVPEVLVITISDKNQSYDA